MRRETAVVFQTFKRKEQLDWQTIFRTKRRIVWMTKIKKLKATSGAKQTLTKLEKFQTKKTLGANIAQPISASKQSQKLTTRK